MRLGIVKPNYPNEHRIALLPRHVDKKCVNELIVETGFGKNQEISDLEYIEAGCQIVSRKEIYKSCDAIFSLKLIQASDYDDLRTGQMVLGWTHPMGSGATFMKEQAIPKKLIIVDLDNIYPTIFYEEKKYPISTIPRNFIKKNSFYAGYASVTHALVCFGLIPDNSTKVAILSAGNVSQGSFTAINHYGADVQLFYRKTMPEFYEKISDFDIIINGIEVDGTCDHIITKEQLREVKNGALIIDAAADAANAIEGTRYTTHHQPVYKENGIYFYNINNAPSIFHRTVSNEISRVFSKYVFNNNIQAFYDIIK